MLTIQAYFFSFALIFFLLQQANARFEDLDINNYGKLYSKMKSLENFDKNKLRFLKNVNYDEHIINTINEYVKDKQSSNDTCAKILDLWRGDLTNKELWSLTGKYLKHITI